MLKTIMSEPRVDHSQELSNVLSLIARINTIATQPDDTLKQTAQQIADAVISSTDVASVAIMTRSPHAVDELTLSGWSIHSRKSDSYEFSRPLHVKLSHSWFAEDAIVNTIELSDVSEAEQATFIGCSVSELKQITDGIKIKSAFAAKLIARGHVIGLVMFGFTYQHDSTKLHQELPSSISASIGLALDNKMLAEQNRHLDREVHRSVAKLKALDEAKDDFISMASHQLRTPLTSIKGYTSMVLEGDAGKITPTQTKLLTQSFFSAQRMVYLIADLLNVSRIRTGKFSMDPMPVDLSEIVSQELEQLKQIAESRSLKLTYKKPKTFPKVMLDDVKIRQVIMNFVDNAIYYTPDGGHIEVAVKQTPDYVELTVTDDGMGVPKADQPHLFTKFYRAGNARKARPDGTGLGLFMAKKVVIAHHGSLIVKTAEGKGSTFGFRFAKNKHHA